MRHAQPSYGGAQVEKALRLIAAVLKKSRELEKQYRTRLTTLGFSAEQSKALSSITPGSGVRSLVASIPAAEFFAEVRAEARHLAMLNTKRENVVRALTEYGELVRKLCAALPAEHRTEARWAAAHLQSSVVLVVNEAFAAAHQADSELMNSLIWAEDHASDREAFLQSVMSSMLGYFNGDAGALFFAEDGSFRLSTRTDEPHPDGSTYTLPDKTLATRSRALDTTKPGDASLVMLPSWRQSHRYVWTIAIAPGVLQITFGSPRRMHPREAMLIRTISDHSLLALRRMEREQRLRDLSIRMLDVEEIERRKIARELHDDAGQSLVVVRLQLEMLELGLPAESAAAKETLAEIRTLTEKTIIGVRRLISDLSPAVLEQLGLGAAIRQLTNRFRTYYNARIRLHIARLPRLNPRIELVIYRIIQESFSNISRHSAAANVNIALSSTDKLLRLIVEDDGKGFDVAEGLGRRNCFGLLGIRERVTLVGGRFQINSTRICGDNGSGKTPNGTKILVELPLTREYRGLPSA